MPKVLGRNVNPKGSDQLVSVEQNVKPLENPFFGIVCRDGAMIMLKAVGVDPLPNYKRGPAARWDAYLYVPDPDALATEFASRNVEFSEPHKDTHDGLRGFELRDAMATSCFSAALGHEWGRNTTRVLQVTARPKMCWSRRAKDARG